MTINTAGALTISTVSSLPSFGLNDLTDVTLTEPILDGQYLGYNQTDGQWENLTVALPANTVPGTYTKVTVTDKGVVTVGANPTTLAGYNITDAQPLDADLTAIAAITGTNGLLRKTAANTWSLETITFGTAATANVTTSPTDTTSGRVWRTNDLVKTTSASDSTAGRILRVGDFGLGGTGILSADFNAIAITGSYYNSDGLIPGLPVDGSLYTVMHASRSASDMSQIAFDVYSSTAGQPVFVRSKAGGVWGDWEQIWTSVTTPTLGSVTSVGITGNDGIIVANSPITSSGNISLDLGNITPTSINTATLTVTGTTTLAATTSIGSVSSTEIAYLDGVTSLIQTQLNNRQPLDADLTAIAALAGTSGLLRKTATDTWSLDTASYLTGVAITAVTTGEILKWSGTAWVNNTLSEAGVQSALGFTPVQQGGGISQTTNKVYIGWTSGAGLKCTVDSTDLGSFIFGTKSQAATPVTVAERDASGVITAAAFNTTSTQRVKTLIKPIRKSYIDRFSKLQAKEYDRTDFKQHEFGFIAEDVIKLYPEIVSVDDTGNPTGIDYSKLSTIITAKVQEQQKTIDALTKKIDAIMELLNGK